jgi:hypothetical protein
MLFPGAWGKMILEKNLKQKISWHCPFKESIHTDSESEELQNHGVEKGDFERPVRRIFCPRLACRHLVWTYLEF